MEEKTPVQISRDLVRDGAVHLVLGQTMKAANAFAKAKQVLEENMSAFDKWDKKNAEEDISRLEWTITFTEREKTLFTPPGKKINPLPHYFKPAITILARRILDGKCWLELIEQPGGTGDKGRNFYVDDWNLIFALSTGYWTTRISASYEAEDGTKRKREMEDPYVTIEVPASYRKAAKAIARRLPQELYWTEIRIPVITAKVNLEARFFKYACKDMLEPYIL